MALVSALLGLTSVAPAFAQDAGQAKPPAAAPAPQAAPTAPAAPAPQAAPTAPGTPAPQAAPTPPAAPTSPTTPTDPAAPSAPPAGAAPEASPPPAAAEPPSSPPAGPPAPGAGALEPKPSGPPPEPGSKVPAIVVLGLAGATAVVGTIFGVMALGAASDFEATPTAENADKVDQTSLIADASFAATLALGLTGFTLLFSADPPAKQGAVRGTTAQKKAAPRGFVVPFAGPKGGGAAATFTF